MRTFLFLLCFWISSQGSSAFDWNMSVKKSGSTIYACSRDTVMFPYLFNLSESESVVTMTWTYHGNNVTKSIGTLFVNDFMTSKTYFNRVTLHKNGSFTMQNVNVQDTGNYILKIQTQNKNQSKQMYTKELSLVVSKNLMYKGNNLIANLSNKADWNSDTESFSLSLACGDFIFKNNEAPINVEWVTPGGSVKNSTKYSDRKFYLQLDNPVEGGQYVCKIPELSLSTVCATSNDSTQVTVNLNENRARIILLESNNKQFKKEFIKLKEQDEQLREQDERLLEQNKQLQKQDERLREQDKQLQKQDAHVQQEIDKLKGRVSEINALVTNDCGDLYIYGSGKKNIHLNPSQAVEIYCDQDTDGGRWNVFQRRKDDSVDFYRGWYDYREGFGDPNNEFWLGLETLHRMTSDGRKYELRFDLEKRDGSEYYAVYDDFHIESENEDYTVRFSGYRGNAGDAFSYHKNEKFSTKDRDNDKSDEDCAVNRHGGWWYYKCSDSNLNGRFGDTRHGAGVCWDRLTGYRDSLKRTEMKFRVKY